MPDVCKSEENILMYYITKEGHPVKRNTPLDTVEITKEEYERICKERNSTLR